MAGALGGCCLQSGLEQTAVGGNSDGILGICFEKQSEVSFWKSEARARPGERISWVGWFHEPMSE